MRNTDSWLLVVMLVLVLIVLAANYEELEKIQGRIQRMEQLLK